MFGALTFFSPPEKVIGFIVGSNVYYRCSERMVRKEIVEISGFGGKFSVDFGWQTNTIEGLTVDLKGWADNYEGCFAKGLAGASQG